MHQLPEHDCITVGRTPGVELQWIGRIGKIIILNSLTFKVLTKH